MARPITAPTEPYLGSTHAVVAETIAAVAHDGQLFASVQQLRRLASTRLLVQASNPVWAGVLDERFSLGCETLALRLAEQFRSGW